MKRFATVMLCCGLFVCAARAQAHEGVMSEGEVEALRDAAYIPQDRIAAFEKILDSRTTHLDSLLKSRHHVSFEDDLHDLLDQISAIADELNDNLDTYRAQHRDVRKALPRLQQELDRWTRSLEATPQDAEDKVIRKLAVDAVEDVRVQAREMAPELDQYFAAHPEAAKAERERLEHAHDPRNAPLQ